MTKEELEQEAEKKCVCTDESMRIMYRIGFIDGAEPREKRIAELEAQNLQLLKEWREMDKAKQKAELKVAELMGDVSTLEQDYKRLEAQIEKMKCCENCKNEGDYKEPYRYGTGWCNICKRHKVAKGNFDKWEIKEK